MADTFELHLRRLERFRFEADFANPDIPSLVVDEPPPLGEGHGPNPARLLALAVGNCLSASLLFCLSKSRVEVSAMRAHITGEYRRNERDRLRIGRLDVEIVVETDPADAAKLQRCLGLFEDFCVVTATVRKGVTVGVRVLDAQGALLYEDDGSAR